MQNVHPYLRTITDISTLDCVVPVTLHEDAGPYTKNLGANVVAWAGAICRSRMGLQVRSPHAHRPEFGAAQSHSCGMERFVQRL